MSKSALREQYDDIVTWLQVATAKAGVRGLKDCSKIDELSRVSLEAIDQLDEMAAALDSLVRCIEVDKRVLRTTWESSDEAAHLLIKHYGKEKPPEEM